MDISKLTYTKGDSEWVPKESVRKTFAKADRISKTVGMEVQAVSPMYQKPEGMLSPHLVFVLSGGEKKEKDFLRELVKRQYLRSLRVVFMSEKGQGLQPYQMQEKWLDIQNNGKYTIDGQTYHLDKTDKVFLLSDVDEFYDQLVEIRKKTTSDNQGQWIVSNPCFEIWLYYCYRNNPKTDLYSLISLKPAKRSKGLKRLVSTLVIGGINPLTAFGQMKDGINHSKARFSVDTNNIPELFATEMHEMAQYMVDTMENNKNEYSEFVKQKEEKRKQMRKSFVCNIEDQLPSK